MDTQELTRDEIERMASGIPLPSSFPVRQMCIGQPHIDIKQGVATMVCDISWGHIHRTIHFSVDERYSPYLCHERSDAFLIGLLSVAMRERCNIRCTASVTTDLLYQLENSLLPALMKYDPDLYRPVIEAETSSDPLPCAGAVGTGCSCGIDSLHAIKALTKTPFHEMRLTHLMLNNVGAFSAKGETSRARYQDQVDNARSFATRYGYELIITDSDFADAIPQNHLRTHLYSSCFAIYALRKLWKRYFYASTGCDLESYFGLSHHSRYDAAKYDLLALPAFSIPSLRIETEGAACSRFEKTRVLADYEPAWHFLSVCLKQGKGHCGHCPKCQRTLWMLDALGKLDQFREVFDVDAYRCQRTSYLQELYLAHLRGTLMVDEAYNALKHEISPIQRLKARISFPRVYRLLRCLYHNLTRHGR